MTKRYLLREYFEVDLEESKKHLTESQKSGNDLYLVGIIQAADIKNGNGRIYPKRLLEREMEIYKKLVKEGRAAGELDHPEYSEVKLSNVSHLLEDFWWDGNYVYGRVRVLPTPMGNILRTLVESGVKVGISSRALGDVKETSGGIIVEEMSLICFDIVQNPSTKNAFMLKEWMGNESLVFNKSDRINRKIRHIIDEYHL
ncbi:MAG: primosomal protein [Patescibacteria group bacterium]|nr:primosomal protein [Patescibacteria group bacterium]